MEYLLRGDFSLPLTFWYYWTKYLFAWSFQSGAPNLDGLIRLPGRLLSLIVFALFGNLTASYFYIGFSFLLVFVSFYVFARFFLHVKNHLILITTSMLFTFNPAFLGNVSKVGLIAAAALLPLCLTLAKRFIETRRVLYLIGIVVLLNYSLLHPFTFTVNFIITAAYIAERLLQLRLVTSHGPKLLLAGVLGLLLNAYLILPIISIGSIDKSTLSQDTSGQPVDYFSLVEVANTKDLLTAFSLSKGVLKDYEFYNESSRSFYMTGIFGLYVVLLALYLYARPRLTPPEQRTSLAFIGGLLILLVLSTGTIFVSKLIELLISLPGGWIFRSPLKWQLYIPFFLIGLLALLLPKIKNKYSLQLVLGALSISLALTSTYIGLDIFEHLLRPKTIHTFSSLPLQKLNNSSLLYVSSPGCSDYAHTHPDVIGEFNQLAISTNVQVKTADASDLNRLNLSAYNFILTCKEEFGIDSITADRFARTGHYDNGTFILYENTLPQAPASAITTLFTSPDKQGSNEREIFARQFLKSGYNQIAGTQHLNSIEITQPFQNITGSNISSDIVTVQKALKPGTARLYQNTATPALFYSQTDKQISISAQPAEGYRRLGPYVDLPNHGDITIQYRDNLIPYRNLIDNGSFESGTWTQRVGDCFHYDDKPVLDMKLDRNAADGRQSLALIAGRHLACTEHAPVLVKPDTAYLFEFNYQGDSRGTDTSVEVTFDDPNNTSIDEHPTIATNWQRYSKIIKVPRGAKKATISLYGHPPGEGVHPAATRYDNVKLYEIPAALDDFYLVSGRPLESKPPASITSDSINPTKRLIHVKGAGGAFLLRVQDSYHPKWALRLATGSTVGKHLQLDGNENAWLLDVSTICKAPGSCMSKPDGSYDIELVMEFTPQKWFIVGIVISVLTSVGLLFMFAFSWYRGSRIK
jgi:hypothetical protein